jgi:hypothetical protein
VRGRTPEGDALTALVLPAFEVPHLFDRDPGEAAGELQVRILRIVLVLEHRLGVERGSQVLGDLSLGEHSEARVVAERLEHVDVARATEGDEDRSSGRIGELRKPLKIETGVHEQHVRADLRLDDVWLRSRDLLDGRNPKPFVRCVLDLRTLDGLEDEASARLIESRPQGCRR